MKLIKFSILAAALACGLANAQTAYTTPVGYETNSFDVGFNFVGIRLHESSVINGDIETITSTTVADTDVADFATVLGTSGASGTYIIEFGDGSGIYQLVSTWSGSSIDVAADLTTDLAPEVSYSIRPAATLASIFGATNDVANDGAGLGAGSGGPASSPTIDQVWVPDGLGGYDRYYYDAFAPPAFAPSWAQIDNSAFGATAVDADSIVFSYPSGFVINAKTDGSLIVSGSVKLDVTEMDLNTGFNFLSSIAPAGATIATAFGLNNEAALQAGSGGPASSPTIDQIWIPDGLGGYNRYYYDSFAPPAFSPSWAIIDSSAFGSTAVDATSIPLPSGYVVNSPSGGLFIQGIPDWDQ